MMRKFASQLFKGATTGVRFCFSGGDHHEIDYHAVVTKNTKSGTAIDMQATISTPTRSLAGSPE
jgi:hypothetical protein